MTKVINIDDVDVNCFSEPWKLEVFSKFRKTMLDGDNKFPCIFGVAGVKLRQVRYFSFDSFSDCPDIDGLADALRAYFAMARSYGKNTSLVVFFKPADTKHSIEDYESHFSESIL